MPRTHTSRPRLRRHPFELARRLACLAAAALLPAVGAAAPPETLAPAQLHAGDRAVVRSVFSGDSVEEFPAEIVGVLSGGRVEGQTIIARATSERLQRLGVAQGMSGSPVYVGGKLIGALASSWPYAREPLFGITPIGEMLAVLDHPDAPLTSPAAGPAGVEMAALPQDVQFAGYRWDDGETAVPAASREPGAGQGGPTALPTPIACAGLAPEALDRLQQWLTPLGFRLVPGGASTTATGEPVRLEPGAAVAVDLVRGDLQLSALGTLTWRDGDRVLLFGHWFFEAGDVLLPLSSARVTTTVASDYVSFKLGARDREIGIVTQDRRSGVAGRIGPHAPLLPLSVRVEGTRPRPLTCRFEVVEDRTLAPQLIGAVALNSLLESGGTGANQSLRWSLSLHRPGASPLVLRDRAAGDAALNELMTAISRPLAFLFGNPYERLRLDSVEVAIRVDPGRAQWTLREARLLDAAVRPGGRARVECRFERWRGVRETRRLEIPVAPELPDGRYSLWLGGGAELTHVEAARFPARYRPTSLDDAWRRLAALRSSDALYAVVLGSAPDVSSGGRDYPELPASAAAVLSTDLSAGDLAGRSATALLGETRLPLGGVTRGELQLSLRVQSNAP